MDLWPGLITTVARIPSKQLIPPPRSSWMSCRHECNVGVDLRPVPIPVPIFAWLKFNNPNAPAVKREAEEDWGGEP
jgi:hypothetical protein